MAFTDDLKADIGKILAESWTVRDGQQIPEPKDVQLGNDAVKLDGTVLYADLAESTDLVMRYPAKIVGKIYKCYLNAACKILKECGGTITAFDGDRVMAVFIGERPNTSAARAALAIHHAVHNLINPAILERFPKDLPRDFAIQQAVGIDASSLLIARTGIRGSNDLVWIGRAPNYAAKLCALREGSYATYITKAVFDKMNDSMKTTGSGESMWEQRTWTARSETVYRSKWRKAL